VLIRNENSWNEIKNEDWSFWDFSLVAKYTAHKKQLEALHRQELQILQQIVDKQQELLRAKQLLR
jgi:hypothetical protein